MQRRGRLRFARARVAKKAATRRRRRTLAAPSYRGPTRRTLTGPSYFDVTRRTLTGPSYCGAAKRTRAERAQQHAVSRLEKNALRHVPGGGERLAAE